jgi:hypothetical protein
MRTAGQAIVGYRNKVGTYGERVNSWNSAHLSDGCSVAALKKRGSAGLVYLLRGRLIHLRNRDALVSSLPR